VGRFLTGRRSGDCGESLRSRSAVLAALVRYFPNTFELVTPALLLAVAIGIPLGMLSAVSKDAWIDHLARVVSVSGVALPAFWLGLMLQLLVALHLGWLPLGGRLPLTAAPPEPITHLRLVDEVLRCQWGAFLEGLAPA